MKRVLFAIVIFSLIVNVLLILAQNKNIVLYKNIINNINNFCSDSSIISLDTIEETLMDSAFIAYRNESYTSLLKKVACNASTFKAKYNSANDSLNQIVITSATNYLFNTLTDSNGIFDHWMGTTWDYNGITVEPLKNGIACGYFVSTPLKQLGFNLNRYKLAQQYSHSIVNSLCSSKTIKKYNDLEKVIKVIKSKKNKLYIVGLDYHVGFLANIDGDVFFIHSDFFTMKVVKEKAETSPALESSNLFVLGNLIGDNSQLTKKWLKGDAIKIIP